MTGQGIRRGARTRIATAALGAGITATVLGGAMLAAGPAGAAASPAAQAATAAAARAAAGTPVSSAVARLNSPARQRFVPWGRATAGSQRHDDPAGPRWRPPRTAWASAEAVLTAVSCTGRSQCTATGMASTRSGQNAKTLAERWNGTAWAVQSTPTPTSRTVLGGTLEGGVSCTSSTACVADGFSYSKKSMHLLGEGWNGRTWSTQPDAAPAVAAQPGHRISCTWAKDCMAVGGAAARRRPWPSTGTGGSGPP